MEPLVSVIIPCYKAAPYVGAAISSALQQTWTNVEVVVVDDGSTDGSLEVAQSFTGARCRVVKQGRNSGAGAARNKGLELARGQFIQFLDADDVLAPDKIRIQLARLLAPGNDGCSATATCIKFSQIPEDGQHEHVPIYRDLDPIDWLVISWQGGGAMHSAGWLIHADMAKRVGPWMTRLCPNDDGEYFTRVVLQSRKVLYCQEAVSYYRKPRPGSLSGNRSRAAMEGLLESLLTGADRLLAREISSRTRLAAAGNLRRFSYMNYPRFRDLVKISEARIKTLGAPYVPYQGSRPAKLVARVTGWRLACWLDYSIATARRGARLFRGNAGMHSRGYS